MTRTPQEEPKEARAPAEQAAERAILHVRLSGHRWLDRRGRAWLVGCFAVVSLAVGLVFAAAGAWPVAGFFGLDAALLWWALAVSARGARAYEDVTVTPIALTLAQIDEGGGRRVWRFNPLWSRLARRRDEEFGLLHLFVAHRGESVEIARCLGPGEKADFAEALAAALAQARRGMG
jgi:uncharacterized membrane protein